MSRWPVRDGRRRRIASAIIVGAAIGGVVAFFLPWLWFYYANGYGDPGSGPTTSVDPSLAPVGPLSVRSWEAWPCRGPCVLYAAFARWGMCFATPGPTNSGS